MASSDLSAEGLGLKKDVERLQDIIDTAQTVPMLLRSSYGFKYLETLQDLLVKLIEKIEVIDAKTDT